MIIIGSLILLAVIGVVIGMVLSNRREARQIEWIEQQTVSYNDSIQSLTNSTIAKGDSLASLGARHDEAYEVELLKAYELYGDAMEFRLKDGQIPSGVEALKGKRQALESQLYEAYGSFIEKAEIFSDDEEIATEFKERAKSISDIIDISIFEKEKDNNTELNPINEN